MTDWLDDLAEDHPIIDEDMKDRVREAKIFDRRFRLIINEEWGEG